MSLTLTNNIVEIVKEYIRENQEYITNMRPIDRTANFLLEWDDYMWMGGVLGDVNEQPTQEQRDLVLKMFKVFVEELGAYQDINKRREYAQAFNTNDEGPCCIFYGNNTKVNDDITEYIPAQPEQPRRRRVRTPLPTNSPEPTPEPQPNP